MAEAQQLPLELTETDLAALIRRTARVFQTTASSKGLNLQVTVGAKRESEQAVIWVQDTVDALDAEHLPHIFDRFYRVDQARSRSTGGTGLGLAIAKQLVEAQKGTIAVASEPGEETTFSVRFPLNLDRD